MLVGVVACVFTAVAATSAKNSQDAHVQLQSSVARLAVAAPAAVSGDRALLDQYCVVCHNQRRTTAGLMLDALDASDVAADARTWEKVVRRLRSRSMPPAGARRPDDGSYVALASHLEAALDSAAAASPNPGRPSVHRLNRAEYANAVRDLLAVDIDVRAMLPADDSGYGFDNIADVLSVSPGLLERYLAAAARIGRLAVGDPAIRPGIVAYRTSPQALQDDRMSEDLPFGSRGGIAVRHQFPVDGEYVLKVRLQRTYTEIIRGMNQPNLLEVRLDRARLEAFTVGGPMERREVAAGPQQPSQRAADEGLEVRFATRAGSRLIAADFVNEPVLKEGMFVPRPPVASFEYASRADGDAAIDRIEIHGPYHATSPEESASRRRIFVCQPTALDQQDQCARQILSALARRAYRRPVTDVDLDGLMQVYAAGKEGGFDTGIEWAIERVLVDPDFLFRVERPPARAKAGASYRLSDLELASRLSFFLWSSVPDDQLLEVAIAGRLRDPAVLEQQVRRMLRDDRSKALVTNFAGQWLWQRNIRMHAPDPNIFSDFDDTLRQAFQTETELFLESQFRDDRPVTDLLTANYTFVNERLARHYDIPNVYGNHFRRIALPDERRAGLLGHGSVLTVTSYAHRTSPVVRGKWLLENLFGAPPPPPPANIPALRENDERGKPTSVRERLEEHRRNPVCSTCHARMDPLGFALENFDATGRWRATEDGGTPIDASGTLPDGTKFDGPVAFRQALFARRDELVATLIEKLLTYALGRGVEYYDMPAVRAVARQSAPSGDRWSAIVLGIVKSIPFQMSRVPE